MGKVRGGSFLNNNPGNNENNIDDILDILQKKKSEDIKNNDFKDDTPTRIDTQAPVAKTNPEQAPKSKTAADRASTPPKTVQKKASVYERGAQGGVSLDDFDELITRPVQPQKKRKKVRLPSAAKVLIYLFCVITVSIILSVAAIKMTYLPLSKRIKKLQSTSKKAQRFQM